MLVVCSRDCQRAVWSLHQVQCRDAASKIKTLGLLFYYVGDGVQTVLIRYTGLLRFQMSVIHWDVWIRYVLILECFMGRFIDDVESAYRASSEVLTSLSGEPTHAVRLVIDSGTAKAELQPLNELRTLSTRLCDLNSRLDSLQQLTKDGQPGYLVCTSFQHGMRHVWPFLAMRAPPT
jgi:hypothetical protein